MGNATVSKAVSHGIGFEVRQNASIAAKDAAMSFVVPLIMVYVNVHVVKMVELGVNVTLSYGEGAGYLFRMYRSAACISSAMGGSAR